MRTSFWTTLTVHPSVLHRIIFAPCMMHTPSLKTVSLFVHSSVLHRLTFAPCLVHTPTFWAKCCLAHFTAVFLELCTMPYAHSFILRKLSTTFTAASLELELCNSPDPDANSSILGLGMIVHPSAEFSYRIPVLLFYHIFPAGLILLHKEDSRVSSHFCIVGLVMILCFGYSQVFSAE